MSQQLANDIWPKLKFYGGFDQRKADDAKVQGAAGRVLVEFEDGRQYEVNFESIALITDWIERRAREQGLAFEAEPGLIILKEVTLTNMKNAVADLALQGEFGFFNRLKEWSPEAEKRFLDKYERDMPHLAFEYPTAKD